MVAHAKLLGPVKASIDGCDVDLGPPLQRAVFATLATHASQVVSREELVDAVWGMDPPATAVNAIYSYIARLRAKLEPARELRARSELLVSDGFGYMLRLPPQQIDKQRFEACLENAKQLRLTQALHSAVAELDTALALWQGTPYGGTPGPFAESERARLTELHLVAKEDRTELLLELDRHADIVGELFGFARQHPLRERVRYLLMMCYVRLGRQAEALTEYLDLRATLAEELGVEPSEQLQQFYREMLQRDAGRLPTSGAAAVRLVEIGMAGRISAPAQLTRDVPGFTGRGAELRQLRDLMVVANHSGESALVVLTGGPGVGKTALAVHFAHAVSRDFPDGQLYLDLRGFAETGAQMEPTEALSHLLSALGASGVAAVDGTSIESSDLERLATLYRSIVAGRRLLVVLDNAAFVEQVRPLLPGTPSCLVVVTSRNRLSGLVARDGARQVTLDVMREDDAVRLFSNVVGRTFGPADMPAVRSLVAACGRLPLALRVAAARVNCAPSAPDAITGFDRREPLGWLSVPSDDQSSVRAVFSWSLRALPPHAEAMFRALGRHTGPEITLAKAVTLTGSSPFDARRALEELVEASLVEELVQDRFRLTGLAYAYARSLQHPTPDD